MRKSPPWIYATIFTIKGGVPARLVGLKAVNGRYGWIAREAIDA